MASIPRAGRCEPKGALMGSNAGITSIDFDSAVSLCFSVCLASFIWHHDGCNCWWWLFLLCSGFLPAGCVQRLCQSDLDSRWPQTEGKFLTGLTLRRQSPGLWCLCKRFKGQALLLQFTLQQGVWGWWGGARLLRPQNISNLKMSTNTV